MKICNIIISAAIALVMATSCNKDINKTSTPVTIPEGNSIGFGASTSYQNMPKTKTEYSGDYTTIGSNKYERINWLSNDMIRVFCMKATEMSGSYHYADYTVKDTSAKDYFSFAEIHPSTDNGLQWSTEPFPHYFYALYPSTTQLPDAKIKQDSTDTNRAKITGRIPATQDAAESSNFATDHIYKPNMNYAYMYAGTKVTEMPESKKVKLEFKPLVTTLELSLKTTATDPVTAKLESITLSSKQTTSYLTGDFTADLYFQDSESAEVPQKEEVAMAISDIQNGSNSITVTLPNGGVMLDKDAYHKVTLLALPVAQTDLTITLAFADGSKRSLLLKNSSGNITIDACKKVNITMSVPRATTVIFEVTGPSTIFAHTGETKNKELKITSYSSNAVGKTKLPWTAEFSVDDGATWSTTKPTWLTTFPTSGEGSLVESTYSIGVKDNPEDKGWEGSTTPVGTEDAPRDLSCYDIYGNATGGTEGSAPYNTANCYVISAPGWYMIPCVYGNAIKNGTTNSSAYTSSYSGTYALAKFINHAGQDIEDPWIVKNTTDGSTKINIDGAKLLWQTDTDLITNVEHVKYGDKDYIKFYVKVPITQSNAVVAAMSGTTTVWSWHLWIMDNPEINLSTLPVTPDPSYSTITNNMMTSILGFSKEKRAVMREVLVKLTQTRTGKTKTISIVQDGSVAGAHVVHYQWGRKDPMVPSVVGENTRRGLYDESNSSVSFSTAGANASVYQMSILNPMTFYRYSSSTLSWSSTRYFNLWNTGLTTLGADEAVTKTVYDPCPPGFKVPNKGAFTGFTSNPTEDVAWNAESPDKCYCIQTDPNVVLGMYFFANHSDINGGVIFLTNRIGYIGHNSGNPVDHASSGKYFTAAYDDEGKSIYYLNFVNGGAGVKILATNAGWSAGAGFAIVPVAE